MEKHYSHNNFHQNAHRADIELYHKLVYFPKIIEDLCRSAIADIVADKIELSYHLRESLNNNTDGISHDYSKSDIIEAIQFAQKLIANNKVVNIFEAGFRNGDDSKKHLAKVVFRVRKASDRTNDIIVVLGKTDKTYKVVTAWLNDANDNHMENFHSERYVQSSK